MLKWFRFKRGCVWWTLHKGYTLPAVLLQLWVPSYSHIWPRLKTHTAVQLFWTAKQEGNAKSQLWRSVGMWHLLDIVEKCAYFQTVFPARSSECYNHLYTWKESGIVVWRAGKRRALQRSLVPAPFSPLHSFPITVWSRCKCGIVGCEKLQKWSVTASHGLTSEKCGWRVIFQS